MRPDQIRDDGDIDLGATHAMVRKPRERRQVVCRILHREIADGRTVWVVLDRVVHDWGQGTLGGWAVSGAVTTELRQVSV